MTLRDVHVKRITLNVDEIEARDLLVRVPRACVAFATDGGPQVEPVTVVFMDGTYLIGTTSKTASHLTIGEEVVLVVDDGVQFFDLRAIYVRGRVRPLREMNAPESDSFWFEVRPTRTVAWDYARIREADDAS